MVPLAWVYPKRPNITTWTIWHEKKRGRPLPASLAKVLDYSHSMVAGGFEVMSYATRLMPGTSATMRPEMRANTS